MKERFLSVKSIYILYFRAAEKMIIVWLQTLMALYAASLSPFGGCAGGGGCKQ